MEMKKHEQAISEDRNHRLRLESAVNGIIEHNRNFYTYSIVHSSLVVMPESHQMLDLLKGRLNEVLLREYCIL